MLSPRFEEALVFAARLHAKQVRKGAGTPYIAHLLSVAGLAIEFGGTEAQAIAALLHDSIEDQASSFGGAPALRSEILSRFGEEVLALVDACTDTDQDPKPDWWTRKRRYIAHIALADSHVALVSACDKLHNARAICSDLLRAQDIAVFDRFTAGREGTLWYYEELVVAFQKALPHPVTHELAEAVSEMRNLADALALQGASNNES